MALVAYVTLTATATATELEPRLNLSHIECVGNGTAEVHFVLVHAPEASDYGAVGYEIVTPDGQTIAAVAPFIKKTGDTVHYANTISGGNGIYTVTGGWVMVHHDVYDVANPGEQIEITSCDMQPTPTPSPSPSPEPIICPLEPQEGRTIINFDANSFLRSDADKAQATGGPFATSLPTGEYEVTLASYDKHSSKPTPIQVNERWFLKLRNTAGETVAITSATSDLPENTDLLAKVVDASLTIPQDVLSVITRHAAYPDSSSPNSITPVCAAFDEVDAPTPSPSPEPSPAPSPSPSPSPTPSPTPEASSEPRSVGIAVNKTDHKDTIRAGETLTYTIEVENAGEEDFTSVTIKDTVPSALTVTNISGGGILEGNTVTWKRLGLAAGEKITVTVTARVKTDTDAGHVLSNSVTARSVDKGPAATDTDTTIVEGNPRIAAVITEAQPSPIAVPVTAATGMNAQAALAAISGASGLVTFALRRWWV